MAHNGWTLNERFTNGKKSVGPAPLGSLTSATSFAGAETRISATSSHKKKMKLSENPYQIPCPILSFHTFRPSKTNACASSLPLLSLVASRSQSMHVLASARSERVGRHGRSTLFQSCFWSFDNSTVRKRNHWRYLHNIPCNLVCIVDVVSKSGEKSYESEHCRHIHAFQQASKLKELPYMLDLGQASLDESSVQTAKHNAQADW